MLRRCATFVLAGLCFVFSSCDRIRKQKQQEEALSELKDSKKELLNSAVMTDEGMTIDMEKVKKAQQTMKQSGDKLGGKMGEALKIAAELQEDLNETVAKCVKASDEAVPCLDMKALSTTRNYAGAIEKFKTLISVNEETLASFQAFQPDLMKRLDAIGFTGDERNGFDGGFERKWKKTSELVNVIRNADIEFGKTGILLMEGLQKGDAHWHWDEETQQATFQTDAQVEWYNGHMERIATLGNTQTKAQEELIQHVKTQ